MPSALLLILGGDIPGLVAVTPASAAAATSAYAMTADLGTVSGIQSAAYAINDNSQGGWAHPARFTSTPPSERRDRCQRLPPHSQKHAFLLTQLVSAPRTYHPPA